MAERYRCNKQTRWHWRPVLVGCSLTVHALGYNAAMSEFELIARFFKRTGRTLPPQVLLGIGDDCALIAPAQMSQAISSDMLIEGRHFFADVDPRSLGHKALAVNLSDLAAMGAQPQGFTLALALPDSDPTWLDAFAAGLFALADQHQCALIGGDTTRGPRNICITVFGQVDPQRALRRGAARAGDDVWVSGTLGDARLALAWRRNELDVTNHQTEAYAQAVQRMDWPEPRVALGSALIGIAHAAIDVSDGLVGDLRHLLHASALGATIDVDRLPAGLALAGQPQAIRRAFCLNGGDDYELCFTAPPGRCDAVLRAGAASSTALTRIGSVTAATGIVLRDEYGAPLDLPLASFDHFSPP